MSKPRPIRVLQFGTGRLLRGLCDACVDVATRAGRFDGAIVAVQSTDRGNAAALNAQGGIFTLVERGLEGGRSVERIRSISAITRALRVTEDRGAICAIAASQDLRIIVSNVTEAGFLEESFSTRMTAILHERFRRLGAAAPRLFVIPTELVEQNGAALAGMVTTVVATYPDAERFAQWLSERVRFCSSLVDRIVTGAPNAEERAQLESRLGHTDELITVCEPYRLWAVEGDPRELREAFPIEGADTGVVFASDIAPLRERKIRLLNGAHTTLAPLAILAGVETVQEAADHELLGPFLEHILFREIVPSARLPEDDAMGFARAVIERFRNPWLRHPWRTIVSDQSLKFRLRVLPSIHDYAARFGRAPAGLTLSLAAHLHLTQQGMMPELATIPGLPEAVERASRVWTWDSVAEALRRVVSSHELS